MPVLTPTLLLILDGWGIAPASSGNAVSLARTPVLDALRALPSQSRLTCSGRAVGLPEGFIGNSEVGHMNIGAGRVIFQDMTRIDMAIEDGSFARNPVLLDLMRTTREKGGRLHLLGLLSDGGVHSHLRHLCALLAMARTEGVEVFVHPFMDGRDTPPDSGLGFMRTLCGEMERIGAGRVASLCGRFYAMDRDTRWERVREAWNCLVLGNGVVVEDPVAAVQAAYDAGVTDEFILPSNVVREGEAPVTIDDTDGVFFFNFRADRARELCQALYSPDFSAFAREKTPALAGFATMTAYDASFPMPVAFAKQARSNTLGEVVSSLGIQQLRIAETEKYAHVTYFFNGGREEPFPGEDRVLVNSPRDVATYDLKPEMSVHGVTDELISRWQRGGYSLAVCNLANLDMVGHTGVLSAAVRACEAVDECVGRILAAVRESGGRVLVTADHGNAETMRDANGKPHTAHTLNPVPLVLIDADSTVLLRSEGILGDIAPTILDLWGIAQPEDMTGESLLKGIH